MNCRWLGRIGFAEALALQERIVAEKIASPERPDELLLLDAQSGASHPGKPAADQDEDDDEPRHTAPSAP